MTTFRNQPPAWNDWGRVRRRAVVQALRDRLAQQPQHLVPLQDVQLRLPLRGSRYRGLQQVALANIIGSAGRSLDFDRSFLPRHAYLEERWKRVAEAYYQGRALPPVELYKMGEVYFVKDGHHRISVARAHGWLTIEADVTEYVVDVPLGPCLSVHNLLLQEEYSDFLEWTQLQRVRPQQRIWFSALGGYLDLVQHINRHRDALTQEYGEPVPVEAAVASWYDQFYSPTVDVIRQHDIVAQFPGRTEADLYRCIMRYRQARQQEHGTDPGHELAALAYAARFGRRSIRARLSRRRRLLARSMRAVRALRFLPSWRNRKS